MRRTAFALLFAALFVAGCFGGGEGPAPTGGPPVLAPVAVERIDAPGATVEALGPGVRLTYEGAMTGSKSHALSVPPEAYLLRAQFEVEGTASRGFSILEAATAQTRCFTTTPLAASRVITCTGVTVLDTDLIHAANYTITMSVGAPATGPMLPGSSAAPTKYKLIVDVLPGPLDGPAGLLNLSAIAPVQYEIAKQQTTHVKSSLDGARLFVEINLPQGPGPWPTILISSPYNQAVRDAGGLTQGARVKDFVPRGYALVVADVRGFANSEGCVEVWGPKEQQDQYDLVEWIAKQEWSDGRVAMYGQSYVGTTPHEAAFKQAPHLTTIATVAGLTDPYFDWHYGGVPNGESSGSPAAYSAATDQPPRVPRNPNEVGGWVNGLPDWFALARTQGCDLAPMVVAANDPNAVYGEFFKQRNFSAKAHEIKVPVLYTQGYIDTNVKATQALHFFNAITTPKLGFFGPWLHRHPPRGDFDLILHAWMDHWMMDRPTNVLAMPISQSITNVDTLRADEEWPPTDTDEVLLYPNGQQGSLGPDPPGGAWQTQWVAAAGPAAMASTSNVATFRSPPMPSRLLVSGEMILDFTAKLEGGENTHFAATLVDVEPRSGTTVEVRFGMLNAGLRNGYEKYQPVPQGQDVRYRMRFLPVEYVVEAGHQLVLTVGPANALQSATPPGRVTFYTGLEKTPILHLPILDEPADVPAPLSVFGFGAFRSTPPTGA